MSDIFVVVGVYVDKYGNRRNEIKAVDFSLSAANDIAHSWRRRLNTLWDVRVFHYRSVNFRSIGF